MNTLCALTLGVLFSATALADMHELSEQDLQLATGQEGLTLSAKLDFATGTRLSYANPGAQYKNPLPNGEHYWLVVDNVTGSIEAKDLKIDYVADFGPNDNVGAVQYTLPEEIIFSDFKTAGVFLGPTKQVGSSHQFIIGLEIDGALQFPAGTKMYQFATK